MEVFKSLKNYKGGSFKSFFGTISIRQINHHLKRVWDEQLQLPHRQEDQEGKSPVSSLENISSEKISPEQRAIRESQQEDIPEDIVIREGQNTVVDFALDVLAQKGPKENKCRIAIRKRYNEDWRWSKVGLAVGMTANHAEKMVERNYKKLRKILEDIGWSLEDILWD